MNTTLHIGNSVVLGIIVILLIFYVAYKFAQSLFNPNHYAAWDRAHRGVGWIIIVLLLLLAVANWDTIRVVFWKTVAAAKIDVDKKDEPQGKTTHVQIGSDNDTSKANVAPTNEVKTVTTEAKETNKVETAAAPTNKGGVKTSVESDDSRATSRIEMAPGSRLIQTFNIGGGKTEITINEASSHDRREKIVIDRKVDDKPAQTNAPTAAKKPQPEAKKEKEGFKIVGQDNIAIDQKTGLDSTNCPLKVIIDPVTLSNKKLLRMGAFVWPYPTNEVVRTELSKAVSNMLGQFYGLKAEGVEKLGADPVKNLDRLQNLFQEFLDERDKELSGKPWIEISNWKKRIEEAGLKIKVWIAQKEDEQAQTAIEKILVK